MSGMQPVPLRERQRQLLNLLRRHGIQNLGHEDARLHARLDQERERFQENSPGREVEVQACSRLSIFGPATADVE